MWSWDEVFEVLFDMNNGGDGGDDNGGGGDDGDGSGGDALVLQHKMGAYDSGVSEHANIW